MANENEREKRETLADVVAEIRRDIKLGNNYYAANLPDRIEAAWRRERESLMLGPRSWEECIERYKKAREIHDDLY